MIRLLSFKKLVKHTSCSQLFRHAEHHFSAAFLCRNITQGVVRSCARARLGHSPLHTGREDGLSPRQATSFLRLLLLLLLVLLQGEDSSASKKKWGGRKPGTVASLYPLKPAAKYFKCPYAKGSGCTEGTDGTDRGYSGAWHASGQPRASRTYDHRALRAVLPKTLACHLPIEQ